MSSFLKKRSPAQGRAKGFTVIEILVALAILSVLAAVAWPAYNNYSVKSKFSEVVLATAPTKSAVSACVASGDCVSGNAVNLAFGQVQNTTLMAGYNATADQPMYAPAKATSQSPSSIGYSVMYAFEKGYNDYKVLGRSDATTTSLTASNYNAGNFVMADPGVPGNYCFSNTQTGQPVCLAGSSIPAAYFDAYYPPNTAILIARQQNSMLAGAASAPQSLPCVGAAGCSPPTKYVASVSYDLRGVITATAQSSGGLGGETFVLTPSVANGRADWTVSGTCKTRSGGPLC